MLKFEINRGLGSFSPADQDQAQRQLAELKRIMDLSDRGEESQAVEEIKAMIQADPLFIRGYALLGELLFSQDREEEATEVYVAGCRQVLDIIPPNFQGPLDMENAEVQCFLRCHTGFVEDLTLRGEYAQALEATRRQLGFDPDDMFERFREVGELAIKAGHPDEAESLLSQQLEKRPTAWYSLGYLSFSRGDFAQAALRLRRAFVLAPYVADIVTARFTDPNVFWECGPQAPRYEEDLLYVHTLGGDLWCDDSEARAFIEWLSQTSTAMRERAEMAAVSEACFRAGRIDAAAEKTFQSLWETIDQASSELLIAPVRNPDDDGDMTPWEYLDLHGQNQQFDDDGEEHGEGCGCGRC